ncbi:MAG: DUF4192 domain-containing protein [Gemmatimonadota bacterium]
MDNTNPRPAAGAGQAANPAASDTVRGDAGHPARPPARRSQPPVRLSSPAGVLAAVPHLLGFHPGRSLVVIGADGPRGRVRFGCRYDLPDPPDPGTAAAIAEHAASVLARERLTTVIVVGYGPGALVTPVADVLVPVLRERGLSLRELLRAEDGRYWSYLCTEPACCPPEGVPFDTGSHPVAAAMTVAGLPAYPDREALARSLGPVTGEAASLMRAATRRAYDRAGALVAQATRAGQPGADQGSADHACAGQGGAGQGGARQGGARQGGPDHACADHACADHACADHGSAGPGGAGQGGGEQGGAFRFVLAEGKRAVRDAIAAYRGGSAVTDDQFAWLAVVLTDVRVRDDAWARMEPEHAAAHLRLWTDVVRRAEPALVPAPAALLGFVAWQSGNGALAGLAIERALAADPEYSLALLLRDIVAAGVPPSAARLPMTPEEVEESYARPGRGRRRGRRGSPAEDR